VGRGEGRPSTSPPRPFLFRVVLTSARRCTSARPSARRKIDRNGGSLNARRLLALRGNEQRELLVAIDSVLRVRDEHVSHSDTNQLHSLDYSVLRRITSQ